MKSLCTVKDTFCSNLILLLEEGTLISVILKVVMFHSKNDKWKGFFTTILWLRV